MSIIILWIMDQALESISKNAEQECIFLTEDVLTKYPK